MTATDLFFHFVRDALQEVKNNIKKYIWLLAGLFILANLEEVYKVVGGQEGDGGSISIALVSIILTFIITAKIILMHKKDATSNEKMIYVLVPFLLYSFYYSLLFFIGLIFFIIPGLWVLIFLSQAPLLAALSSTEGSLFKASISLVKKNVKLVAWISVATVLLEFFALAFAPIANPQLRLILTAIFSVPDALLSVVLTIASVRIFYYLNENPVPCP
jgi:hypothetical protein